MDEVTIQKIATEIAHHLPSYAWVLLLVQVVILAAAAAVGASFGEYLKTRGKHLATKADFDSLQNQLRANTELVETIKAEVGQKDWAQRERTNLRRIKLEELIEKMHNCIAGVERLGSRAVAGDYEAGEHDPLSHLAAIAALHFPELENEVFRFSQKWREQARLGLNHTIVVKSMGIDFDAYRTANDIFQQQWGSGYKELLAAQAELTTAARRLLVEIMGVDEHEHPSQLQP